MNLYTLDAPQRWRAGYAGGVPFHHDCGRCGAPEPVVHGFLGAGPSYGEVALLPAPSGLYRLALLCESCYAKEVGR
jgi:hypothetical protein